MVSRRPHQGRGLRGAVVMRKSCPESIAEDGSGRGEYKRSKPLALSEIRPVPRRGLSRIEAAMYIGISPSKFDELVEDGRMPKAIRLDGRKLWDIRELDAAFDAFSDEADLADDTWKDFGQQPLKR